MYDVVHKYFRDHEAYLKDNRIYIKNQIPLYSNDKQVGIRFELEIEDKSMGGFSVRTTETGYHIYDLEVMNLQNIEPTVIESNMFENEYDLMKKLEFFLKRLMNP